MTFAANLSTMFNDLAFLDRFDAAAKAGFEAVEFLWPYDFSASIINQKLKSNNLTLALFNTPTISGQWGLGALPKFKQEAIKGINLALSYAKELDCKNIHLMAGISKDKNNTHTFIQNIKYAAKKFAPNNILLEALCPQVKKDYFLQSQFDTLKIVQEVDLENVLIQFDFYHAELVDGDSFNLLKKLKDKIGHVQIASIPHRHEPDPIWVKQLLNELKNIDYKGFIGCEYFPKTDLSWFMPYKKDAYV